jgi:hypothetical protein
MNASARSVRHVSTVALGLVALGAAAHAAHAEPQYRNVTAGGSLRPGVYGRIEMRGDTAPPPVIYKAPVLANASIDHVQGRPVYLYVPPGQVRKWKQSCAKWKACDDPVLFVRMDHSPSLWGKWRERREELALHQHAAD